MLLTIYAKRYFSAPKHRRTCASLTKRDKLDVININTTGNEPKGNNYGSATKTTSYADL